jgi:hypothetical protein
MLRRKVLLKKGFVNVNNYYYNIDNETIRYKNIDDKEIIFLKNLSNTFEQIFDYNEDDNEILQDYIFDDNNDVTNIIEE